MKSFLKSLDRYFFGTVEEEENGIKPYFYISLLFGVIVAMIVTVNMLL